MPSTLTLDQRSFREEITAWAPTGPPSDWIGWSPPGGDLDAEDQGQVRYCIYGLGRPETEYSLDGIKHWRKYPYNVWVFDHYGESGSEITEQLEAALDDTGLASWEFTVDVVSPPAKHPNGLWFQLVEGETWPTT